MLNKKTHYNYKLKELAKNLRKNSTLSEILLWQKLKGGQLRSLDFHRQKPIGNYIVDFYCAKKKLIIEIDGGTHFNKIKEDEVRDERLKNLGFTVLHFGDKQIKENLYGVLKEIEDWIDRH